MKEEKVFPEWHVVIDLVNSTDKYMLNKDYWYGNVVFTRVYQPGFSTNIDYLIVTRDGLALHVLYNNEKNKIVHAEVYIINECGCEG